MENRELRGLVRAAVRGDREAAASMFDLYYPRVYRYALGKLGSTSDAEDVASETFSRVLRDLGRFRWKGAGFEAWLFRIASNTINDHFRRGAREGTSEDVVKTLELVPGTEDTEMQVQSLETRRELAELVEGLPDDQREVVLLRFAAGLDTNEAAAAMGRTVNATRQLQFRALSNLRKRIDEEPARAAR